MPSTENDSFNDSSDTDFPVSGDIQHDPSDPFDGGESPDGPVQELPNDRVIIKNAGLSVQTLEYDKFMASLNQHIIEAGGYISASTQNGNPVSDPDDMRFASLTVRIPADKLDEFLNTVGTLGNITSRSETAEDITTAYIDTEAKLEALRTEYDALLAMLEKAEAVSDLVSIQDRLSQVRYQIEAQERIIRSYDDKVAFSTVSMSVYEVRRETPVGDETFWQEISRRFSESLADVGHGFTRVSAWVLGNLPEILVWLVVIAIIVLIIVLCVKHSKRRKAQKNIPGGNAGAAAGRAAGNVLPQQAAGNAADGANGADAPKAPQK